MLALVLIAATTDIDLYLREGCHLRFADDDVWQVVPRRGNSTTIDLASDAAKTELLKYASAAVEPFKKDWPKILLHKFDLKEAKKLLAKKGDGEEGDD